VGSGVILVGVCVCVVYVVVLLVEREGRMVGGKKGGRVVKSNFQ
jgi:hypothetical protein